jgi:hypothetical protein
MKLYKNYLTLFFLILLTTNFSNGQVSYSPINFDHGRWVYTSFQKGPYWGTSYENDTLCFYFKGDTIIRNHFYKKLYFSGKSSSYMGRKDVSGYAGAFRDDTLHRTVWYGNEVAYNYNLSIGDTVKFQYSSAIVEKIDSVSYCGKYFPRFIFKDAPIEGALIENIRALYVYVWPYDGETNYRKFECYYETNSTACVSCAGTLKANSIHTLNYSLYPNPTDGKVNVLSSEGLKLVNVYNSSGYLILQWNEEKAHFIIDLSSYSPGIYMVIIKSEKGIYSEKIVIK